jgi:(2Fe-2S) ferredoxin
MPEEIILEKLTRPEKPSILPYCFHMLVCTGPRCTQGEAETLFKTIGDRLKINGLDSGDLRVKRTRCNCFAVCKGGPIIVIHPEGVWYYGVTPEVFERILKEHLKEGKPVQEYIFHQNKKVEGSFSTECSLEK